MINKQFRQPGRLMRKAVSGHLLRQRINCWRIVRADRAAFLIDGAEYFARLADCWERACRGIYICGWDIDSRASLRRGNKEQRENYELGRFLNRLCEEKPNLHVYILVWDFAAVYALERETLPVLRLGWNTHQRVHFVMDDQHPFGASHHQKIVVVDDKVAFSGGLDITKWRWDSRRHKGLDERRRDASGQAYQPFHDVQMAVDGAAAEALADLFRRRWREATGEELEPPPVVDDDPWPRALEPVVERVTVGIARTLPSFRNRPEVREVENLFLDMIFAAQDCIYIENQYFTSAAICGALEKRLAEPEGPEIVLILPRNSVGWLEQSTMDIKRGLLLYRLKMADLYGRLAIYTPMSAEPKKRALNVHAKVMVVDDVWTRVGSANLSNRSMGLDTECDLVLETRKDGDGCTAAEELRCRLLAEHLGVEAEKVRLAQAEHGSLIKAIESLRESDQGMIPMEVDEPDEWEKSLANGLGLADPERPMQAERLLERFMPDDVERDERKGYRKFLIFLVMLILIAAAWRWTPLSEWLDPQTMMSLASSLRDDSLAPLFVVVGFVVGGILMIPFTFMVGLVAMVFSPFWAVAYSLLGGVVSSVAGYGLGAALGRKAVRRVGGGKLNRISKKVARGGILSVVALRLIPIAHYTIINVIAGASHLKLKDFVLGTILGFLPGIIGITLFAERLQAILRNPRLEDMLILPALLVAVGIGMFGIFRWVKKKLDMTGGTGGS